MSIKSLDHKEVVVNFHDVTFNKNRISIQKQKTIRYIKYLVAFLFAVVLVTALTIINIRFANNGKYNFQDLFYIFSTNNIFSTNTSQLTNVTTSTGPTFGAFSFTDLPPIRKATWISIATALAGIGLAISGSISQGLTKNPLSDPTTLGATEAVIFGSILMNVLVGSIVDANNFQYVYLAFSFLGGLLSVGFILVILKYLSNLNYLKITLTGLAISIFFKTLNFLLRINNASAIRTSFAISIGGAENIYGLYPSQETVLYIGIVLVAIGFITSIFLSKNLSLLELGDDKATSLGVNIKSVKIFGLLVILILIPISVSLVGNAAFVGLFAPHIVRIIFRTRDYRIVVPMGALLGASVMSLGLTLNTFTSTIPSSIYMVFIGAPMLIYLGWKQKSQ
ncbi:iron complex transport system permease protein [Mycoplasmoides fastidiosum]|uniref:Iron complex transport system permease protein n=1 Tax=Mycoplasmoides fastidiosum TaxID=92758 RepID=A0ABU0LYK3_9BACT|nr:iron ABC transporter permease [Mycoplasmoides fastidiosum]MDQ0513788.1 iron complex transport system permease protein [Mycoplasmoides fastidiosum]UUD37794.1 iron ABC transporter permease [Mycoplasmoides fastidiosum]